MPQLYGDGKPLRTPAFVTGFETPDRKLQRLRETNEALKKQEEREQERRNRELFTQLERQAELKFSPPSPPRTADTPLDPEEEITSWLGSQDSYEGWLDDRLEAHEATFGMTPLFGSQAYDSAERLALEDWRNEQAHRPDDLLADMEVGLFVRSRELREGVTRPPPDVDSKYDILIDSIKANNPGADIDTFIKGLEKDARGEDALGSKATEQEVREWVYRQLRTQKHLLDVLDEWGFPSGEGIGVPPSAWDEALRREAEENGEFFKDFPDPPGLLEKLKSTLNLKFIPVPVSIDLETAEIGGPRLLSMAEVHTFFQPGVDIIAAAVLRGEISKEAMVIFEGRPVTDVQPIETGTGLGGAARAGEIAFGELTGVETTAVSDALRSQLAEDILSDAISPEYLLVALPFAGVGVRGLTGTLKVLRITDNLIGTGGAVPALFRGGVAGVRGIPRIPAALRMTPAATRGIYRGLTAFARQGEIALRNIPRAIKNNPVFQQGLEGLRAARAGLVGRGGTPEEFLRAIGADNPQRLRRVTKDLIQGNPSTVDNLPLRQAVEADLTSGRSMEDIIETGVTARPEGSPTFWLDEAGGGFLGRSKVEITENNLFKTLTAGEPVSHTGLQRVTRDLGLLDPGLVERASSLEMTELLQARRVAQSLGARTPKQLNKAELIEVIENAALPLSKSPTRNQLLKEISAAGKKGESVSAAVEGRLWETLSDTDVVDLFTAIAEGRLQPGVLPTQLVSGKGAVGLSKLKFEAFNTARSLSARTKSIESYISGLEKLAAKSKPGSIARMSLEADAKVARWSFDTQFGLKPLAEAQSDVLDSLVVLTKEHRGTPEERLAALATGRSKEITDEIALFLGRFPKLSKTQRDRMGKRLLIQILDIETGVEVYDAGRQLEVMLKVVGVDQKLKDQAYRALQILTTKGATPSSSEIGAMRKVLDPVLGKGATSQLLNARKLTTKGGELVINSIGLPRALMASSDISALARQGGIIGPRMPIQWAKMAGRSIRAFWQPEYADEVRRSIVNSGVIRLDGGEVVDMYEYATKHADLFIASDAGQLGLTFKEEEWMTHFASKWGWHLPKDAAGRFSLNPLRWEKVPFPVPLAQSERAYVVGLDKLRMDFFSNEMKKLIQRGMANGKPPSLENFKQLALFTNNGTGRGKMWEFLRSSTPVLNALFFAPRLVLSRFAIIGDVVRATVRGGPMRRVVWETLAADGVTLAGVMFLINTSLNAAGIDTSIDFQNPLKKGKDGKLRPNTDFMKIRVGDTHIDFLASMGPTQRLLVGLAIAAYQGDGEMAAQLVETFGRSKEAPVPSGFHDVLTGEDFIGGKIELTLDDLLLDVVASRSIPLSWQGPVEAIAAMRGEFDIDTGEAVIDLATNKPNKDESVIAGVALSAELIGGGVVSFFNPGEKLREADEELLQDLLGEGTIKPVDGQTINEVKDLNSIQAKELRESRDSQSKDLENQQEEQGLWRDSEWAKNRKEEREFHEELRLTGGYTNPETGKWEALFGPGGSWRYSEIDAMLLNHRIDGSEWRFRDGQNTSAEINVTRALFGREEEDIEDIDNPVDKLIAEYWQIEPIAHLTVGGEYDKESFQAAREVKEAEIAAAVGDPEAVREYFDSFTTKRDTDVQARARVAKEDQQTFEDTPVYMEGVTDATINNLLDNTSEYLRSVGSRWGLARYIQWLYYQGEQYQTNEWAIAYWVAVGERDVVLNPERTRIVFTNPDTVLFYPGLFGDLPDAEKQGFFDLHQDLLGKDLIQGAVEAGEISQQSEETELFRPQPLFQR